MRKKTFESMENKKHMEKKKKKDLNMIIIGLQNNTKKWSHILNSLQIQIPINQHQILYIKYNHTHVDHNPQQPKLHVPTIEINQ
jgi:hypothetical protein